jgi:hypothetical protein|tara:strand:+ start:194 stop:496 length:303 start_codon:yes stop_codon:yes gene_type:complete
MTQKTKKRLYPPTVIYFDDDSQRFYLELDGHECYLMLTNLGAEIVNYQINNSSTYLAGISGAALSEKDCMIFLTNDDEKELKKIAKLLSNEECWRDEIYT